MTACRNSPRIFSMNALSAKEKDDLLGAAETHCKILGARLTEIRRKVLELVLEYPDVVKAYDVLNDLQSIRRNAAPPTVYRALAFLVEVGILHRMESLNGFVFCPQFRHPHISVIINCERCGHIEEIAAEKPVAYLIDFCKKSGFTLAQKPIALSGICIKCEREAR